MRAVNKSGYHISTMTSKSPYLPKYTLDQLSERVCLKLSFFSNKFNTSNIWNGIPELCVRIEDEPRAVSSVFADVKREDQRINTDPIVFTHNIILTRVYVLLYYRHRDDAIYKAIVFPELKKHMGIYADDKQLKYIIHAETDKILEQDKLIEKYIAEKKREVKPVFQYVAHSGIEADHLCIEYNEEQLFRNMSEIIKELSTDYQTYLDEADVWYNAKQVVHTLRDINRPELMIERVASGLVHGQIHREYEGAQIILLAAYMMIKATEGHRHFDNFITKMELYAINDFTELHVISDNIQRVRKQLDEILPIDDYDYIGEQPLTPETFTKEDLEKALSKYKEEIQTLTAERDDLRKQIPSEESAEQEAINWHDKVRLDLLLRLMKKDHVNLDKHGNKTKAAQIMKMVTGLPLQTCKNYCSSPNLNTTEHQDEVLKVNTELQALDMTIRL